MIIDAILTILALLPLQIRRSNPSRRLLRLAIGLPCD